ncbi:zinc-binding dehydrogenase [Rhodobacteraceae bacterium WD3A24]|nr:zinc-binding dehydrogenase [Rhodobacteraceae bacterium WD3A24]
MRAIRIAAPGAAPALEEIARPEPGPGEVRVAIAACGLNFADLLMVDGRYQDTPAAPFTLGMELAGTVEALGPGLDGPAPGTRVAVFAGQGGLAEAGCFPAERCRPLPEAMRFVEAAGFQIAYGTAHLALARRARLTAGETLLVLGAAGGVGLTAVEIGRRMGARVIACARGREKLDVARRAGADHLIDSETADIRAEVRALGGADVVYDPVGGAQFTAALRATRPEGRVLVIGFASGEVPPVPANILMVKNISVMGFYWGGYMAFCPEAVGESLDTLMRWRAEGGLRPHVGHTLPLGRALEGLALLRGRRATGKVVITMD